MTTTVATPAVATAAAPSFPRLTLIELRKTVDTRAARWLIAVMVVVPYTVAILQILLTKVPEERGFLAAFTAQQGLGLVLLPVLGILCVTSEWSQRTTMTTYALVPRRRRIVAAKTAAVAVLSLALTAIALPMAAALNVLAPLVSDNGDQWDLGLRIVAQAALVGVLTALGGVAFGLALMSTPLAIVLYFALPTVLTVVSETVSMLHRALWWVDLNVASTALYTADITQRGWIQVATSFAVWVGVPFLLGSERTVRRDVS